MAITLDYYDTPTPMVVKSYKESVTNGIKQIAEYKYSCKMGFLLRRVNFHNSIATKFLF
jgi:hypothetical protein